MNYSDIEVDDDNITTTTARTAEHRPISILKWAQATPLGSKGHNTWECEVQPNKKQQKTSNETKKNAKGKRRGPNYSQ